MKVYTLLRACQDLNGGSCETYRPPRQKQTDLGCPVALLKLE